MYFFVLFVLKDEFRLRLISPIDSLVLVWPGRPGFQVTTFQQVVSSGGSRGGTGGAAAPPPPPLFLDQTEARRAEKFFWETGPLPLIQERMIYLILSCLISGSEWPGPHLFQGLDPALVSFPGQGLLVDSGCSKVGKRYPPDKFAIQRTNQ